VTLAPAASDAFPRRDPVGPAQAALPAEHVALIADAIAVQAGDVDRFGVQRSALDLLAAHGLLGTALPGGAQRELAELLAGSDASTWFCWAQHQTPLRTLEAAGADVPQLLRTQVLPDLRTGTQLAAVAFAHVRRPGPPNPVARRVPGGWRIDGTLDWVTSWDIADVVMVMARADDDRLVCAYLPAGRSAESTAGLAVGEPLRLLAMSGTHTRPLRLDGVVVPDDRVGAILDLQAWRERDRVTTSDAGPAVFGLVRASIADLATIASSRRDADLAELAEALTDECRALRSAAYTASDGDAPVPERLSLRARSLDLMSRATTAVVVARAGAAMRSGAPEERRAREALFLQVQAQTAATRAASVALLARASRTSKDARTR
jgi:alkylation response protein AidB-like acyl-CoA dehydrogenase